MSKAMFALAIIEYGRAAYLILKRGGDSETSPGNMSLDEITKVRVWLLNFIMLANVAGIIASMPK